MAVTSGNTVSYESIMKDVRAKKLKPVYLLMGAESYYIDKLAEAVIDATLPEEERDFNMHTFYGSDTDINSVLNAAQSFPMGAEHSLVVLKEAQSMSGLENLTYYLQHPQPTTVLLILYKNGTVDKRKKFVSQIASMGVLFESVKVGEAQLPGLINSYMREKGVGIEEKSVSLIAESVGTDLVRLYGELDKLILSLPKGVAVTSELVEKNIGISKDFNIFELQNALVQKNVFKAFQIVKYFEQNPKNNPVQKTLPALFGFFSTLMLSYYAPQKTVEGIAAWLGQKDWQVRRNIMPAMRNYSAQKVLGILKEIKATDEKTKGVGGYNLANGDPLKQLVGFILEK